MKKQILVVADPRLMHTILSDWTNHADGFELTLAATDERAIELAHQQSFDLVVMDNTVQAIDIKKLKAVMPILDEELQMLSYEGESATDLNARIKAAFDIKRLKRVKRFLILDATEMNDWTGLPGFSTN